MTELLTDVAYVIVHPMGDKDRLCVRDTRKFQAGDHLATKFVYVSKWNGDNEITKKVVLDAMGLARDLDLYLSIDPRMMDIPLIRTDQAGNGCFYAISIDRNETLHVVEAQYFDVQDYQYGYQHSFDDESEAYKTAKLISERYEITLKDDRYLAEAEEPVVNPAFKSGW